MLIYFQFLVSRIKFLFLNSLVFSFNSHILCGVADLSVLSSGEQSHLNCHSDARTGSLVRINIKFQLLLPVSFLHFYLLILAFFTNASIVTISLYIWIKIVTHTLYKILWIKFLWSGFSFKNFLLRHFFIALYYESVWIPLICWKHCSKIIFKGINSTVRLIFI